MVSVFKKGNPNSVNDYPPITIVPFLSKIFEMLLKKQLLYLLTKCIVCVIHNLGLGGIALQFMQSQRSLQI